ncbi:MAG: site-2 protease family protein [Ilumatobacteraceae bacterium]|nr:site-2 protease family protein [Ilumatobacteraceae bacterium]
MTDQKAPEDQLTSADQLATTPESGFAPPNRVDRMKSEIVAGGAVRENGDDELAGGWRGMLAMAALAGLFVWLAFVNVWIFIFVVGVVLSIFLHELGHFMTARWTGMKVTQFFLFFGPRLWSFRRGETEYGVRAIPLGAFVRIIGMNRMDDVEPEDEGRSYRQQSFPKRLLVISAGSIMHILIAIVLLFAVYSTQGEITAQDEPRVIVAAAATELPAAQAGILDDDEIVSVGGIAVTSPVELGETVRSFAPGEIVDVVVIRDGATLTVPVGLGANTGAAEDSPLFGTALLGVRSYSPALYEQHNIPSAAVNSVTDIFPVSWESTQGIVKVLNPVSIVGHLTGSNDDLSSRPTTLYGVATVSDDVGDSSGLGGVLYLLAVLNIFVGVFNMLPLLPLDGGHAAIAIYERFREWRGDSKKRYFADVERLMPFAMAVIVVLSMLMFTGLYLDITEPIG